MAIYDYHKGKERVENILDNELKVVEQGKLPHDDSFTFTNGYYSWVTAIFVDIRDSSSLFADEDKEKVSKIIRSFTSEIIEILRDDDNLREIGIRGDCVYAVYTTPQKTDIYELADRTFWINTYMNMLNKLLAERSLPTIRVGIGMSTAQELVVKAGRKDAGINSKVWIGEAVTKAAHYSSKGNKNGNSVLIFSKCSFDNFIEKLEENDSSKNPREWFTYRYDSDIGWYYPPLSPKSIKNLHGVLHRALQQAVDIDYLRKNPANNCKLPRIYKQEIQPLDNDAIIAFLKAIKGHRFETIYKVTLFTGMREGEVLGLTWDCINFKTGTVTISKQLQKERGGNGEYHLVSTKNGKIRRLTPAASVMEMLRTQHQQQELMSFAAKELWDNKMNLVFTNEVGHNLSAQTVYLHFKKLATACGFPNARFHDLRHSYAVAALQSGDDIKTVQDNLGHHTAAFTLDTYGHVTTQMKIASANRMEKFINSVIC